jgi:hypothetical protein
MCIFGQPDWRESSSTGAARARDRRRSVVALNNIVIVMNVRGFVKGQVRGLFER